MGLDKIFVLILTIGFFAFIAFLAWHSRKNQATGRQQRPTAIEDKPAAAEETDPSAGAAPAVPASKRASKRR